MIEFFDFNSIADSYDLVIIGGGPAGCVAAMYAARDELKTLVLDKSSPGGSMGITAHIENHPGFPDTQSGADLTERYYQHAVKYGAIFRNAICERISIDGPDKYIYLSGREMPVIAKTVIIATGSAPKTLNIPGESKFFGRGVSSCATCDGGFYKDKVVVTVGGGNTALEESIYLTRFVKQVYLVHRREEFRASKIVQRLVMENPKITLVLNSMLTSINGDENISSVNVINLRTNAESVIKTDGVFIFAGQKPATQQFKDLVELDEDGYIVAGEDTHTGIPGLFAAGDVRTKEVRQIATATADGVVAAKMAARHLQELSAGCITADGERVQSE